jgi:eukaryotic-like serine/threonine-protein kinase
MAITTGEKIGRYTVANEIGRGGLAVVYRAMDTVLERSVALKMILPGQQQEERYLRRFNREAKSLAQLSHPSVVKILDYGEYQNTPYLVMEFIPGGTLSKRMGQPMPPQEAASLLAPIARALYHAHQHKVIHRDVKPANILINESGQPMLSDFGIVKLTETDESQSLTGTGVMIGTPAYMAPEQIQGRTVDGRSDIYSLGVVLFELITGRKPYIANTPIEITLKHLNEPVPRARQIIRDLPPDVEQVLLKAMAKKPEDRYQDMAIFADVLERMAAGQKGLSKLTPRSTIQHPTPTLPRTEVEKTRGKEKSAEQPTPGVDALKKKPVVWIAAGVLVVAAIVAGIAFGLPAVHPKPTAVAGVTSIATSATSQPADKATLPPPATTNSPVPPTETHAAVATATDAAPAVTDTATPTINPVNAITSANTQRVTEMHRLEKTSVIQLWWTPDGKWIVDAGAKAITIIDPATMKAAGTISLGNLVPKCMVISSDSQEAVTLIGNQVKFYNLASRTEDKAKGFTFQSGANSMDMSTDMKTIALGMLDNKVQLVNAGDGSIIRVLRSNYGGWSVAFSPDGKQVASGTSQGALMWETATGTWLPIATGQNSLIKSLAYSHDGKLLAGGSDGLIYLWDAATGDEVGTIKGNFSVVNSLAFSPDDQILLTGTDDKTVRLWNVASRSEALQLKNHVSPVFSAVFSPGGDLIASGANEGVIRLWGLP